MLAALLLAATLAPVNHDARSPRKPRYNSAFSGPVPKHLTDADYLSYGPELTTDPKVYAPFLTYAYGKGDRYKINHAAGLKTVLYTNPMMPHKNDLYGVYSWLSPGGAYHSVAAFACDGTQITAYNGNAWIANMMNSGAPAYVTAAVQQYIVQNANANGGDFIDAIFLDNSNDLYGASPSPPCGYTEALYTAGFIKATTLHHKPAFANTLAVADVANQVKGLAGVDGGLYEGCYGNNAGPLPGGLKWERVITSQLLTEQAQKIFWCYSTDVAPASTGTVNRIYEIASFFLAFNPDPGATIYQVAFKTSDYFKVFPEMRFYPTLPKIDPTNPATTIASYRIGTTTLYQNSFASCYYGGQSIGGCQIDVNLANITPGAGTPATVTPNPALSCMVQVSGEDVLAGGTLTMDTPANYTLAPGHAAIYVGCRTPPTRRHHAPRSPSLHDRLRAIYAKLRCRLVRVCDHDRRLYANDRR